MVAGALALLAAGGVGFALMRGGASSGPGGEPAPGTEASSASAQTSLKLAASSSRATLPGPLSGEAAAAAGGSVYVLGGLDAAQSSLSAVLRLGGAGPAASVASLPAPLHDAAAAALGGRVLLIGGGSSASSDVVWAYRPGHGVAQVGRLPAPRSDLVAATVGGRAYVLGGYDGQSLSPDVLSTKDGSAFSRAGTLAVPVRYPAVAASSGTIYMFGGETASGSATDVIQSFDTATGKGRVLGHLPAATEHASALALGGRVYLLGGTVSERPSDRIIAFDPSTGRPKPAGRLPEPVANAAVTVNGQSGYLVGGIGSDGSPLASVVRLRLVTQPASPSHAANGTAAGQGADGSSSAASTRPFEGSLMIADRGNDRILVVDPNKKVLWRYPGPGRPPPAGGFDFPDDAFFIHGGRGIITNQEENETIVELGYPSGKVLWSYGHPGVIGSTAGYLHEPDDAYLLPGGTITVADAQNCRILFIRQSDHSTDQLGTPGNCVHDPPRAFGSPNGDTPLANGDILVSEVNGSYIDEITRSGRVVWSTHLPIAYPSDPQQLGPDLYMAADYTRPGGVVEFNRAGKILWSYRPVSGEGMLDHPSLAEQLPNGLIAVNDDYRDRVVLIDPKTKRIVWQYGRTDQPGTGPDQLNTPDGLDLLSPDGTTPTHPFTG